MSVREEGGAAGHVGHNDAVHFSLLMANERDVALLQMRRSCPHSRSLTCNETPWKVYSAFGQDGDFSERGNG